MMQQRYTCYKCKWQEYKEVKLSYVIIFKDFIYLLVRERGREGEREGEKDQCARHTSVCCFSHAPKWGIWTANQACALTGNRTYNHLVCSLVLNPLSHTSQGSFFFLAVLIGHFLLPYLPNFWFSPLLHLFYCWFPVMCSSFISFFICFLSPFLCFLSLCLHSY